MGIIWIQSSQSQIDLCNTSWKLLPSFYQSLIISSLVFTKISGIRKDPCIKFTLWVLMIRINLVTAGHFSVYSLHLRPIIPWKLAINYRREGCRVTKELQWPWSDDLGYNIAVSLFTLIWWINQASSACTFFNDFKFIYTLVSDITCTVLDID